MKQMQQNENLNQGMYSFKIVCTIEILLKTKLCRKIEKGGGGAGVKGTHQALKPIPPYGAIVTDEKFPQYFPHIRIWVCQKPPNDIWICALNYFETRIQSFCCTFQRSQCSYHQGIIRWKREVQFIHNIVQLDHYSLQSNAS